jgi:hypothetical protein
MEADREDDWRQIRVMIGAFIRVMIRGQLEVD